MYDSDDEIRRKRRRLVVIITIIVLLIIGLIIFLLIRNFSKNKGSSSSELTCTLGISSDVKPDNNGVYHDQLEIGFSEIKTISKDYQIVKQTIGTANNSKNKETFTVTKSGSYHLYGFVEDSAGHKGQCDIKFEVSLSKPECELEVKSGTLGDNDWYRSDVEVVFKSMESNSSSATIVKYYIDKEGASEPGTSVNSYIVKDNGSIGVVGHVIDSTGNEGTCKVTVNKDATVPTCKLKVNSGTVNESGIYTDTPVIGFEDAKDDLSGLAAKGVGISKNYTQETYKVEAEGKTTVVGYVKDNAGNEGSCSIEITRPSSTPTPTPTPTPTTPPSCSITQSGDTYILNISTPGSNAASYGLGDTESYNGKNSISKRSLTHGTHTLHGIVKDSNGNVGRCTYGPFQVRYLRYENIQPGEYVSYDPGVWSQTVGEVKTNGYIWGAQQGVSKSTGRKCDSGDKSTRNGWMILGVDSQNRIVLIHAGTPECMYHSKTADVNSIIRKMNDATNNYLNSKYAEAATILSCTTFTKAYDCNRPSYSTSFFVTGTTYWVGESGGNYSIKAINATGTKIEGSDRSYGIRPMVALKLNVLTNGKDSNGVWTIE